MSLSSDVIVIGAGVLGLASAAELSARGLSVIVIDAGGPNASSVAAGMIAPAMESALDDPPAETVELLKTARALWPAFAARHGLTLIEDGAGWRGPDAEGIEARLRAHGFRTVRTKNGLRAPDDARIDAVAALEALGHGSRRVPSRARSVIRVDGGWVVTTEDGQETTGRRLVLATGAGRALGGLPTRVAGLIRAVTPVRGQLDFVPGAAPDVPTRTRAGYAVPVAGGMLIGASMEAGRRDLTPDPAAARSRIRAVCEVLELPAGDAEPRVGIRGALPDGLPAAGELDGVVVALAPRRNGWLLAPLVAGVVADAVQGTPPGPHAAYLDPTRPGLIARAG